MKYIHQCIQVIWCHQTGRSPRNQFQSTESNLLLVMTAYCLYQAHLTAKYLTAHFTNASKVQILPCIINKNCWSMENQTVQIDSSKNILNIVLWGKWKVAENCCSFLAFGFSHTSKTALSFSSRGMYAKMQNFIMVWENISPLLG